jgi:endo-1,3-1,4-beta-glycanase ExoK
MAGFRHAILATLGIAAAGIAQAGQAGQSFLDDFQALDRGRWTVSDGWSNGDWMNCVWSKRAVSVRAGRLSLRIEDAPSGKRLCGEIQSKAVYGYGTFEVLMRTGRGSGLNAALFTYTGPPHGRPHHEIDVEILLRDPGRVEFNTYVDGSPKNGAEARLATPADAAFTHYAFTWTPEGITWFVDGRKVHEAGAEAGLPTEPQKFYASLWGSSTFTDWMGPFDAAALPQETQIEWIAYTRLGEACRFPASILCGGG